MDRLSCPWHVESSQTRDWTRVSCIGRHILNYWTSRKSHNTFNSSCSFYPCPHYSLCLNIVDKMILFKVLPGYSSVQILWLCVLLRGKAKSFIKILCDPELLTPSPAFLTFLLFSCDLPVPRMLFLSFFTQRSPQWCLSYLIVHRPPHTPKHFPFHTLVFSRGFITI